MVSIVTTTSINTTTTTTTWVLSFNDMITWMIIAPYIGISITATTTTVTVDATLCEHDDDVM